MPTHVDVTAGIKEWDALELETEANVRWLVGAALVRMFDEWAATWCGKQVAQSPAIEVESGDSITPPDP